MLNVFHPTWIYRFFYFRYLAMLMKQSFHMGINSLIFDGNFIDHPQDNPANNETENGPQDAAALGMKNTGPQKITGHNQHQGHEKDQ